MTPVTFFPSDSPYANLVLKREDLSETGSHKFRYALHKLQELKASGVKRVVLSTTGNAGITLSHYGAQLGITVICLMSDRGNLSKAAQIEAEGGNVIVTDRPVRFAKYIAKKYELPLLRVSRDMDSVSKYRSLGEELKEQVPEADALVNFATSGASTLGLAEAYETLPAIHLAQAGSSASVVSALHPESVPESDAAGLRDTPYREELLKLIEQSGGDAWYIDDQQRIEAAKVLADMDITSSMESLSSMAAAMQIADRYRQVVIILSGKKWPEVDYIPSLTAKSFTEIDELMSTL